MGLTAAQVFTFAEYAVNNEYYTLAFDWLNAAESKIKDENYTAVSPFQIANTYRRNVVLVMERLRRVDVKCNIKRNSA